MKSVWTDVRFLGPVLLGLLLLFCAVPSPTAREESELAYARAPIAKPAARAPVEKAGKLNRDTISNQETLWEVPTGARPKGILFVAHGCSHQGTDFWPASEDCPDCLGLPEEVRIREQALRLGYVLLAVTSINRESKCWDTQLQPEESVDGQGVATILREVQRRERLEGTPIYALGASSGGAFVLMLPHLIDIKGVCAQIMAVPPQLLHHPPGWRYPPTLFVHMPRDEHTAAGVQQDIAVLKKAGVPTAELRVKPRPLTPQFLSSRSPQISQEMAAAIVRAFYKGGMLAEGSSEAGGLLARDPRRTSHEWQALLEQDMPGIQQLSLQADRSPLTELLNLAWAGHEIVSDYTRVALDWFESGGKTSIG